MSHRNAHQLTPQKHKGKTERPKKKMTGDDAKAYTSAAELEKVAILSPAGNGHHMVNSPDASMKDCISLDENSNENEDNGNDQASSNSPSSPRRIVVRNTFIHEIFSEEEESQSKKLRSLSWPQAGECPLREGEWMTLETESMSVDGSPLRRMHWSKKTWRNKKNNFHHELSRERAVPFFIFAYVIIVNTPRRCDVSSFLISGNYFIAILWGCKTKNYFRYEKWYNFIY